MSRTQTNLISRLERFKHETKHNIMLKSIYKISLSSNLKGYKYKVVNKQSNTYTLYRKNVKIYDYWKQIVIVDKVRKTTTYYNKAIFEINIIDNDYKVI